MPLLPGCSYVRSPQRWRGPCGAKECKALQRDRGAFCFQLFCAFRSACCPDGTGPAAPCCAPPPAAPAASRRPRTYKAPSLIHAHPAAVGSVPSVVSRPSFPVVWEAHLYVIKQMTTVWEKPEYSEYPPEYPAHGREISVDNKR